MQDITVFEKPRCTNCGESLQGAYCHQCGQSVHSVLRPMHGLVEETFETLLHIDGRIVHTLPKLYLHPGRLTLEYFAGRRVRYIAPFRLMFVLCLLAFFALHWSVDHLSILENPQAITGTQNFTDATTPEQVRTSLRQRLDELERARAAEDVPELAQEQIDRAEQSLREQANQRLLQLGAIALPVPSASRASTTGDATAPASSASTAAPQAHAIGKAHAAEAKKTDNEHDLDMGTRIESNWKALSKGTPQERSLARKRMIDGVFGTLPQALLLLSPVFAVLLKLFYLFKRRLYMEHLIVSMHSHAFLFLSLLLITGVSLLGHWVTPHAAWLGTLLKVLLWALLL